MRGLSRHPREFPVQPPKRNFDDRLEGGFGRMLYRAGLEAGTAAHGKLASHGTGNPSASATALCRESSVANERPPDRGKI